MVLIIDERGGRIQESRAIRYKASSRPGTERPRTTFLPAVMMR